MEVMMILECENLSKNYGSVKALDNLTLKIESGKIVGLLGPNGHGKTTLIKTLSGLLSKDKGKVLIDGKRIGVGTKKIVSYLPERSYLSPEMKIKEVVSFFQEFYEDFDAKKADAMLGELSLDKESKLKSLSKGNREKVQLIMVMSRKAKLYLLDEPMGGVDPAARDYILKTIISNYSEDATVIISTHLIQDVEQILDEVVFLKEGKVMLHSDVDELRMEKEKSVDALFREVFSC
ncbi:ABC transporter ATP-binding protein [Butyribacter intestini]|jgi:ABC-2 type transport system ATP-binding protein|nr:ABC transporter ATP-binding protein [Butyribacter intestini]RHP25239.1 ABC transporter ATP-binding protein [Clostridium sp. AF34-13]RHU72436.1 ABC transporter ATP-binding protein [Butyribacter intestini]